MLSTGSRPSHGGHRLALLLAIASACVRACSPAEDAAADGAGDDPAKPAGSSPAASKATRAWVVTRRRGREVESTHRSGRLDGVAAWPRRHGAPPSTPAGAAMIGGAGPVPNFAAVPDVAVDA